MKLRLWILAVLVCIISTTFAGGGQSTEATPTIKIASKDVLIARLNKKTINGNKIHKAIVDHIQEGHLEYFAAKEFTNVNQIDTTYKENVDRRINDKYKENLHNEAFMSAYSQTTEKIKIFVLEILLEDQQDILTQISAYQKKSD